MGGALLYRLALLVSLLRLKKRGGGWSVPQCLLYSKKHFQGRLFRCGVPHPSLLPHFPSSWLRNFALERHLEENLAHIHHVFWFCDSDGIQYSSWISLPD